MGAHGDGDQPEREARERVQSGHALVREPVQARVADERAAHDLPGDARQPEAAGSPAERDPDEDHDREDEERTRLLQELGFGLGHRALPCTANLPSYRYRPSNRRTLAVARTAGGGYALQGLAARHRTLTDAELGQKGRWMATEGFDGGLLV